MAFHQTKHPARRRSWKRGGYLAGMTALAVVLVILINLIAGQLPSHLKEFDLTGNDLYEISDTSTVYLSALSDDVEIVVLAQEDSVDQRITKFLDRYAALSDHITVTELDPVAYPTQASAYDAEENSLIVSCEATGKQRVIPFSDIITYTVDMNSFSYVEDSFDAEGQLTSAIDYVTGDTQKLLYTVTGHGESDLPAAITDAIDKANLSLSSVSPLANGGVPEDCDLLIVNGPTTDLSADEITMFQDYLSGGGQMILLLAQSDAALPNWESFLYDCGLDVADGYIADTAQYYPQFGSPFYLYATLNTASDVCADCDPNALTYLANTRGFTQTAASQAEDAAVTVTPFLTTSENAYAVTETDQVQGSYLLGAVCTWESDTADGETTLEPAAGGRLTVLGSTSFLDEEIISSNPSLANQTIFMNAVTVGFDDLSNLSIPAKSLSVTYNTIVNPGLWSTLYIVLLPIVVLVVGLVIWMRRRKQ